MKNLFLPKIKFPLFLLQCDFQLFLSLILYHFAERRNETKTYDFFENGVTSAVLYNTSYLIHRSVHVSLNQQIRGNLV